MKSTPMKLNVLLSSVLLGCSTLVAADLRIGIIGCDTSHAVAFTDTLNSPTNKFHIPGGKVVAAYKGRGTVLPQ